MLSGIEIKSQSPGKPQFSQIDGILGDVASHYISALNEEMKQGKEVKIISDRKRGQGIAPQPDHLI